MRYLLTFCLLFLIFINKSQAQTTQEGADLLCKCCLPELKKMNKKMARTLEIMLDKEFEQEGAGKAYLQSLPPAETMAFAQELMRCAQAIQTSLETCNMGDAKVKNKTLKDIATENNMSKDEFLEEVTEALIASKKCSLMGKLMKLGLMQGQAGS